MWIVCDIDQRLSRTRTKLLNNGSCLLLIAHIQPMQRFIHDNQVRIFYKRTRQKCQPLFAGRKRKKRTVFQLFDTEYTHPSQSYLLLLLRTLPEQPDRVKETGTYDTQYRYI